MDDIEFVSIKEFAARIGMHPNSVRKAIKAGKLNAIRIGEGKQAAYRIPLTQLHILAIYNIEKVINALIDKKLESKKDSI